MKTKIPASNVKIAQAAAATLVVDHLSKVLGAPSLPASALTQAVIPFYGVNWNRKILTHITTNRMNYELGRLRRPRLPQKEYESLKDFLLQAYSARGLFSPGMEEWQLLADRFRLDSTHEWEEIADLMPFSTSRGIEKPMQLSNIQPEGLEALCASGPSPLLIRSFWSITRTTFSTPAASTFSLTSHKLYTGKQLISATKRHSNRPGLTVSLRPTCHPS